MTSDSMMTANASGVWSRQTSADLERPRSFLGIRGAITGAKADPPPCLAFPGVVYGGDYPLTGVPLKMKVSRDRRPLEWIKRVAKKLVMLDELILEPDGGFRRPGAPKQAFPKRGVNLRWRLDEAKDCVIVDFFKHGQYLPWRHDEFRFMIDEETLNDDGVPVSRGKFTGRRFYYCGRNLGKSVIPGSDGRCGPNMGPQCSSCLRYRPATDAEAYLRLGPSAVDTMYLACVGTSGRTSWNYDLRPVGAISAGKQPSPQFVTWSSLTDSDVISNMSTDVSNMSTRDPDNSEFNSYMSRPDGLTEFTAMSSDEDEHSEEDSGEGVDTAIERGLELHRQGAARSEWRAPEDHVWGAPMKRLETPPENRVVRFSPVEGRATSNSPQSKPSEEPLPTLGQPLTTGTHSPRADGGSSPRGGGPSLWKKLTSWGCCVAVKRCCRRRRAACGAHRGRGLSGGGTGEAPAATEGGGVRSTLRWWRLGQLGRAKDVPVAGDRARGGQGP